MGFFSLSKTCKGYLKPTDSTENAVGFKFVSRKAKSGQVDMTKIIFKVERFI